MQETNNNSNPDQQENFSFTTSQETYNLMKKMFETYPSDPKCSEIGYGNIKKSSNGYVTDSKKCFEMKFMIHQSGLWKGNFRSWYRGESGYDENPIYTIHVSSNKC